MLQPLGVKRHAQACHARGSLSDRPAAPGRRKDRPHAGRARDLLAPAAPGRSCRGACRSRHPPSRPEHRTEKGSSTAERRHHPPQRMRLSTSRSTRSRQPFGSSISISPSGRSTKPHDGGRPAVSVATATGTKRAASPTPRAPSRYWRRQVNSRLRQTPCRCATADTEPPGRDASSTRRSLSAMLQRRRRPPRIPHPPTTVAHDPTRRPLVLWSTVAAAQPGNLLPTWLRRERPQRGSLLYPRCSSKWVRSTRRQSQHVGWTTLRGAGQVCLSAGGAKLRHRYIGYPFRTLATSRALGCTGAGDAFSVTPVSVRSTRASG